jgi:quinol monooxygenase YgiN
MRTAGFVGSDEWSPRAAIFGPKARTVVAVARSYCLPNAHRALSPDRSMGCTMTAFNVVRFRVKPGREQEFLDAHKKAEANWPGLEHANIVKTGERTYCIIAEWTDMDALAKARPNMIATLDSFRGTLEDLGVGLGVTDPVSGPVVLALR